MGWARNKVESWLLELLGKNNKANNKAEKEYSIYLYSANDKSR